jgi:plastocyanin
VAGAALIAGAVPAAGTAGPPASPVAVSVQFDAFAPSDVEVLPGEAVEWTNASTRRHTVTAVDGSFDSGDLLTDDRFSRAFDTVGVVPYHCTVHLNMTGTVDVRRVILDPVPPAAVPAGQHVRLTGRAAVPGEVTVQRDTGDGFRAVATAAPGPGGAWSADVPAVTTADYRAVAGADASTTRHLVVIDRHVLVSARRGRVHVTVSPSDPGARVVLELRLRERFGWWPVRRARLDYVSRADFRIRRRARARVLLVDRDGWTAIATSRTVRAGRRHG